MGKADEALLLLPEKGRKCSGSSPLLLTFKIAEKCCVFSLSPFVD
jgi:hypothetical protein